MKNPIWKKVTPIPPEMNGYGYLYVCRKCGKVITAFQEPRFPCRNCERKRQEESE